MEIEMGLQCTPKTFNENSSIETGINFIGSSLLSTFYSSQAVTWSGTSSQSHNMPPLYNSQALTLSGDSIYEQFNNTLPPSLNLYIVSAMPEWTISKEVSCNLSSEPPLIFSISEDAEKFLSENIDLRKNVFDISGTVAEFIMDKELTAIGEISVFQEDELEPKLFIKYGICGKEYDEILKLWDKACKKIAKSVSISSLENIAVVFDQI